jgi:HEAT repeat protein
LGQLGATEAVPELIALAESDPDPAPQSHAIGALGRIGDARAVAVLVGLLKSPDWLMRSSAVWALGLFADETAIPVLRSAAKRERFFLRGGYRKAIRTIRRRSASDRRKPLRRAVGSHGFGKASASRTCAQTGASAAAVCELAFSREARRAEENSPAKELRLARATRLRPAAAPARP